MDTNSETNSEKAPTKANPQGESAPGTEAKSGPGLAARTASRLKKLKSKLSGHKKDDPNIYPMY